MRFKGLPFFNEICFSCFTYTVTIRFNEFKRNKLHVSSVMIVTQKMFGFCGGLRAVSLFVNRSAMFMMKPSLSQRLVSPLYCFLHQVLFKSQLRQHRT